MSYDENEDVRWQGEEEEHDPQSRLAAHLLIKSEYRPGPSGRTSSCTPRLTRLPLHPLFLLESMRRDVRILLVGDGTSFFHRCPCFQTQHNVLHFTEGVGKSTIVTSLIKEAYVHHVRPRTMLGKHA